MTSCLSIFKMVPTMASESIPSTKSATMKPPSYQEILKEMRNFVNGVTFVSKCSQSELSRSAVFLLKTLPAAREAVMEYACAIFDDAVARYNAAAAANNAEHDPSAIKGSGGPCAPGSSSAVPEKDESVVQEIQDVLTEFIHSNPESWAPIVSSWSLDLLGQLSSKHSDRRGILHASSLNEVLQLWMSCRPTRTLLDLSTLCISTLINSNPDLCIDALLDTSVQHSPHFDWVVAHIGSCFPNTVITRVLACGLKDFCSHDDRTTVTASSSSGGKALLPTPDKKVPKMASVVGILGHLAGQHSEDIRKALLALFVESFCDNPTMQHLATVPFLLQLSSMSTMLQRIVSIEFVKALTPNVLNKLCVQIPLWCQCTGQSPDDLISLSVHLVLKSEEGGEEIIKFLLNVATPSNGNSYRPQVAVVCGHILDFLLFEIQCLINSKSNSYPVDVPILETLNQSVPMLCQHLTNATAKKTYWVTKLLKCLATYGRETKASEIVGYILTNTSDTKQLNLLEHLVTLTEPSVTNDLLEVTISQIFTNTRAKGNDCSLRFLKNLLCLVRWEVEGFKPHSNFTICLQKFLLPLSEQINNANSEAVYCVMEILGHIPLPDSFPMSVLKSLASSAVVYFFQVVTRADVATKISQLATHRKFLSKLCEHYSIQQLVLRSLIEGALDIRNAPHYGSSKRTNDTMINIYGDMEQFSIAGENQKHAVSVTLPQSHSTVFHTGTIGQGLQIPTKYMKNVDVKDTIVNIQLLTEMIKASCVPCRCTADKFVLGPVPTIEGMTTVALLLVELVSSDIMFNGLPWPEEEFGKVTIERDLHIKRMFDDNPVLWDILLLVATFRPALCYCSVLLRALAAILISFWAGCQEKSSVNCPKQLDVTRNLIDTMSIGQILPPPLCHIGEIVDKITPYEVYILLVDIWKFMKENVPSPALFTTVDSHGYHCRDFSQPCEFKYSNRLHCILQNNIGKFGHIFTHFFSCEEQK